MVGNWMNYNRSGDMIEVTIRSSSFQKIDSFRCPLSDTKRLNYIFRTLKKKYGVTIDISKEEDLKWLKG